MVRFDESKVINTLHPEKAEFGKKYWYADDITRLKWTVEQECRNMLGELSGIEDGLFKIDPGYYHYLLYPYEEPPEKRMTERQLAEWLSKGNGEYSRDAYDRAYSYYGYYKSEKNNDVASDVKIRAWDSEEWVEPTVDIYERDCKGGTK